MSRLRGILGAVLRRLNAESFGRGATFFLVSSTLVNASSFLFHMAGSRLLGPRDYGSLSTLTNMTNLIALPFGALQFAVTQAVLENVRDEGLTVVRLLRRTALVGTGLSLLILAFLGRIDAYFHLSSPLPMIIVTVWIPFALLTTFLQGLLIGEFKYYPVAIGTLVGGGLLRLALGVLLIAVGWGVTGAMVSLLVGQLFSIGYLIYQARDSLRSAPHQDHLRVGFRHISMSIAAFAGFTGFTAVDTFLARHYFTSFNAGQYAASAIAAHIALFLPVALVTVSFPHLVGEKVISDASRRLIIRGLLFALGLGLIVAAAFSALPTVVTGFLFGSRFAQAATILRVLVVQSVGLSVLSFLVFIQLARRHLSALVPLLGIGVAVVVAVLHPVTFTGLAWLMLIITTGAVVVVGASLGVAMRASRRMLEVTSAS